MEPRHDLRFAAAQHLLNLVDPTTTHRIEQAVQDTSWLRVFVRSLARRDDEVDDIVQQTCMRALRYQRPVANPQGFLRRIARDQVAEWRRAERRRYSREEQAAKPEGYTPVDEFVERQASDALRVSIADAIETLPETLRIVVLQHGRDLSGAEIAQRLGVTPEAVRTRLSRARRLLRQRLAETGALPGVLVFSGLTPQEAIARSRAWQIGSASRGGRRLITSLMAMAAGATFLVCLGPVASASVGPGLLPPPVTIAHVADETAGVALLRTTRPASTPSRSTTLTQIPYVASAAAAGNAAYPNSVPVMSFARPGTAAQGGVVVPSAGAGADATGPGTSFPGTSDRSRQQILIGPSLLQSLGTAAQINAISVRRDGYDLSALDPGTALLTMRLSSRAVGVTGAGPVFAGNHGSDEAIVFHGAVSFPASPALSSRNDPDWSSVHSFTIPVATPFLYSGGTLCIDVEATPTQTTRWPVDYHADLAAGTLIRIGSACGPIAAVSTKTLRASDWQLRAGATARLAMMGERDSLGLLMLGAQPISPGLDLGSVGAPGCTLHVMPILSIPARVTVRPRRSAQHPGIGAVDLQIPNEPQFVGGQFYAQWANMKDLRLTTSDAALVQLAGAVSPLDAATVASGRADGLPMPVTGSVLPGHMPVLRLGVQ